LIIEYVEGVREDAFYRLCGGRCTRGEGGGSLGVSGSCRCYRGDIGSYTDRLRSAPMLIAVHRWGVVGTKKKAMYSWRKHHLYPSTVYTHILQFANAISEITPLGPLCKTPKSPLKRSFCYGKVIYLYSLHETTTKNIIWITIMSLTNAIRNLGMDVDGWWWELVTRTRTTNLVYCKWTMG